MSKAKRVNLKSLIKSLARFNSQFKVKESLKRLLAVKVMNTWRYKSRNILATKAALNFSGPYSRIRPAKLTNQSA